MIHHGKISLKAIEAKDLPWLARLAANPRIHGMLGPEMAEATESTIASHLGATEPGTTVKGFIIIAQEAYVGFIVLNNIHPVNRTACVSLLALEPKAQGRLYARLAGEALRGYAFNTLGMRKIYCFSYSDHRITARLARMAGGVQEAVLRKDLFRGGKYHDRIVWGLLKEEYDGSSS